MVTCKQCINRLDEMKRNGERAQDAYAVGNPAKPQMGHEMFFAEDGRTALCVAKRLDASTR